MKKTNVTLRQRKISNGKISLYLDYYPPILNAETNKYTRREFLLMYLLEKPKNQFQKTANIETLHMAQLIQVKKQNDLLKDHIYTPFELERLELQRIGEQSFIEYFKNISELKDGHNYDIWRIAIRHFELFLKSKEISFQDISVSLIEDYKEYLLKTKSLRGTGKTISRNTALSYHNKIKATLRKAYKDGKLRTDINASIDCIKEQESQRNFLTLSEARQLFATPCPKEIIYRISKFSVLTGLRYSDISKLKWLEVEFIENDGHYIRFQQKKTEGIQSLPISDEAREILGECTELHNQVFHGLKKWDVDRILPIWLAASGITKHITFHCFRHTYATLQISSGTDIYTISKMLGHKSVKTTQIYAKIIDERKRETTHKIIL